MAEIPDTIVLKRDRYLAKRSKELWVRRTLFLLLTAFIVAALANVFGQRSSTSEMAVPAATLTIHSPTSLRSGLTFETRLRIIASQEIKDAIVVLSPEWIEGITFNTIEPSPVGEASKDGRLSFDLGHIPQGQTYSLYLQMQVNPTTFGMRTEETQVFDGKTLLLTSRRDVTIFP
ncbi:MAG: hypothetical protein H0W87_03235 [Actinobacteria bacterium]|nr:hypothetical protein [Actinomycetota bacterium]